MSTPLKIWIRFSKIYNGKELNLRIQELPSSKFEEGMDFMFKYYVPEETIHKAANVAHCEKAFNEYKKYRLMLAKEMNYELDVCCVDEDSGHLKIVALSIMVLEKKGDPPMGWEPLKKFIQTTEIINFVKMVIFLSNAYKVKDKFNLDWYYSDKGVVVHPDYRGLGIAGKMLRARMVKSKERGVPMTGAWMTAFGTQKSATKLGWETVCEVNFKDLGEVGGVTFEEGPQSCKLMVSKVG